MIMTFALRRRRQAKREEHRAHDDLMLLLLWTAARKCHRTRFAWGTCEDPVPLPMFARFQQQGNRLQALASNPHRETALQWSHA
jgi:hypothetical protein